LDFALLICKLFWPTQNFNYAFELGKGKMPVGLESSVRDEER